MQRKTVLEAPRCPTCHSSQTYHRVKDNTRRCKICGAVWSVARKRPIKSDVKVA